MNRNKLGLLVSFSLVAGCGGAPPSAALQPEPPSAVPPPDVAPPAVPRGARLVRMEVVSEPALDGGSPERSTVTYAYAPNGKRASEVHDHGSRRWTVRLMYDDAGRVVLESTTDNGLTGADVESEYDAKGRLARRCTRQNVGVLAVLPNHDCTTFSYDAKDRVDRERTTSFHSHDEPKGAPFLLTEIERDEDGAGRAVEERRVEGGRLRSTRTLQYDAAGRVSVETLDNPLTPDLDERKTYTYGPDGLLVKLVVTRGAEAAMGAKLRDAVYEYANGQVVRASGLLLQETGWRTSRSVARYVYEAP